MSIRLIARDLYRVLREIEDLEKQIAQAPPSKRPAMEQALRRRRAEQVQLRRALDGAKGG
jgi:hypothetical protein